LFSSPADPKDAPSMSSPARYSEDYTRDHCYFPDISSYRLITFFIYNVNIVNVRFIKCRFRGTLIIGPLTAVFVELAVIEETLSRSPIRYSDILEFKRKKQSYFWFPKLITYNLAKRIFTCYWMKEPTGRSTQRIRRSRNSQTPF
jgi:hypothetical protein